jgi:hypothetical protein
VFATGRAILSERLWAQATTGRRQRGAGFAKVKAKERSQTDMKPKSFPRICLDQDLWPLQGWDRSQSKPTSAAVSGLACRVAAVDRGTSFVHEGAGCDGGIWNPDQARCQAWCEESQALNPRAGRSATWKDENRSQFAGVLNDDSTMT